MYVPKGALCVDNNASGCPGTPVQGRIYAVSTSILGIDLAENYPARDDSIEAGDLVSVDPFNPEQIVKSSSPYDRNLLGVISTAPGVVLGGEIEGGRPVALAGRVPVKVSAENGPIKIGDPITASSVPGVGMKATKGGKILGYALEAFDGLASSATHTISVFIHLGEYAASDEPINGLKMKDSVTGEVYCVKIASGEFVKTRGACN